MNTLLKKAGIEDPGEAEELDINEPGNEESQVCNCFIIFNRLTGFDRW